MGYLFKEIEAIRKKPAAYLGKVSISALYHYLLGFQSALYQHICEPDEKIIPLSFELFHDFVANAFEWFESTSGWCNIILKEVEFNEVDGFYKFFELFDAFKALSAESCFLAVLSEENIEYHNKNKFSPKRANPPDYMETEPLYINPIEVYLIKLTVGGYLCMINSLSQPLLERKIYKSEEEVKLYIQTCFGTGLNWEAVAFDKIVI